MPPKLSEVKCLLSSRVYIYEDYTSISHCSSFLKQGWVGIIKTANKSNAENSERRVMRDKVEPPGIKSGVSFFCKQP